MVLQALGLDLATAPAQAQVLGLGLPWRAGAPHGLLDAGSQALQDMVWLHDLAQHRRPFDAVVHCLCTPD